MSDDLAIVGITRFSVVLPENAGGFRLSREENYWWRYWRVFGLRRMQRRFRLFEAFALPSVANIARRYERFQYIILISGNMPLIWKYRLQRMTRDYPWCRIVTVGKHESMTAVRLKAVTEFAGSRRCFTFRLDDDDALAESWIDVVLHHAGMRADDFVFSCDDGYALKRSKRGGVRITPRHYPNNAFGLGYFSSEGRTIYELGNHVTVGARADVVHFSGRRCWIRTVHRYNDSEASVRRPRLSNEEAARLLSQDFGHIDFDKALNAL